MGSQFYHVVIVSKAATTASELRDNVFFTNYRFGWESPGRASCGRWNCHVWQGRWQPSSGRYVSNFDTIFVQELQLKKVVPVVPHKAVAEVSKIGNL
jgi:hypothetical protein